MSRTSRPLLAALAVALCACGGPHEAADERDDSRASIASRYVRVSAPADVALLEAPARVLAGPDAVAVVAVTYRAQVRRVRVQAGSHVAAGDALLDVAAPEIVSAAARYVAAEAPLAIADQRLARLEALRAEGLAEASTLFEVQARAADLREQRATSLATLRAAGLDVRDAARLGRDGTITLTSPIDGVVRELDATPGEVREGGAAPFATIVALHGTRVEARFPRAPPPGARFALLTTDDRDVDLGAVPLGSATSPDDGTTILWLAVPDATDLAPGLRGTLRAAPPAGVLEVPLRAVHAERGESFVLVRAPNAGSGEHRVAVRVLASSGASALVTGALHEGDEVVADAAALLDAPVDDTGHPPARQQAGPLREAP